jgi:hypothetical protein
MKTQQTIDTFEGFAFLKNTEGVGRFNVTVINDYTVEVNTFGVKHSEFNDLETDVRERLKDAGYNVQRMNIEL